MTARIIDGKSIAKELRESLAPRVAALKEQGITPGLTVIVVGDDPASAIYVRNKERACVKLGMNSQVLRFPAETTQEEILNTVRLLNQDDSVHGILVQLPLPAQIDEKAVIDAIPPEKDVDGFSPVNVGRMQIGEPCYLPCTPAGCIRMIESTGTKIDGKNAVVIGRDGVENAYSFTIDKGTGDGIEIDDVVISSDGVVGVVVETGAGFSKVSTILNSSVSAGCYVGENLDVGIAGGDGEGLIFRRGEILRKVPQERLVDELMDEIAHFEGE